MNKKLINYLLNYFNFENSVESVTIVGSLEEKHISEVSDIDIVIITDKLTKNLYHKIVDHARLINLQNIGIDLAPKVNPTFGPLKFDDEKSLVLHIMIYDIESHKQHVLTSPFTCFDWERSNNYIGKKLEEIFPVIQLMPNDFKSARRGFDDYINDLENLSITYREYEFNNDSPNLMTKKYIINPLHITEFCFHIIYNTMSNYIKLIGKHNIKYFNQEFLLRWSEIAGDNFKKYSSLYKSLEYKKKNKIESNFSEIQQTKDFLEHFYHHVLNQEFFSQGLFLRHMKTALNDGRFFGRKNDINIEQINQKKKFQIKFSKESISHYFTSPLNRCLQSLQNIGISEFKTSEMLLEMDYGDADGLFPNEFEDNYPKIFQKWQEGKDEPFPNGENYEMVQNRLFKFLRPFEKDNCLFMTHQGVIRAFVGNSLKIDLNKWYLLKIPHLEPIYYLKSNSGYYIDIDRVLFYKIFTNYLNK